MVDALPPETLLVVNADDPLVARSCPVAPNSTTFGVDDPAQRGATLQHAADSKYCVRCGAPYAYAAAYVGHLGDYRCPACGHSRPPLDVAARSVEQHGIDGVSFDLCMPEGTARVRLQVPGLYNVYNALAAASLARGLGVPLARSGGGSRAGIGGVRPLRAHRGRREVARGAAREEPRRRERDVADAHAGRRTVGRGRRSERRHRGRPRRLVDLGRRLRAARSAARTARRLRRPRRGARASASRTAAWTRSGSRSFRSIGGALDRGLELTEPGGELVFLPTYTAMLELQGVIADRGYARPYWERVA